MKISVLEGTCSMAELRYVTNNDLITYKKFSDTLEMLLDNHEFDSGQGIFTVLYNSTLIKRDENILIKKGFKVLHKYNGDEGLVKVMLLEFKEPRGRAYPEYEEEYEDDDYDGELY